MNKHEFRNMWLTIGSKGVSLAGSSVYAFAMSLYILQVTGSAANFAISLVISSLPRVILSPFVGNLADRSDKKRMVIGADVFSGLLLLGVLAILSGQSLPIMAIYISEALLSTAIVFLDTAYSASAATIVSKTNVIKLNSMNQTISAIIQVLAPILGGLLFVAMDIKLFILINAVSFLAAALAETMIDFKLFSERKAVSTDNTFIEDLKLGLTYLKERPVLVNIMIYALLINFFAGAFSVIFPFDVVQNLKIGARGLGIIEACFPVGAILMSIVVGQKKLGFTQKLFRNCILLMGLGMFLFVVPVLPMVHLGNANVVYYAIAMIAFSGIMVTVNVPLSTFMQICVEEQYRGRVAGILGTGATAVMPLSFLITGSLLAVLPSYWLTAVVGTVIVFTAVHIHFNRNIKRSLDETYANAIQAKPQVENSN